MIIQEKTGNIFFNPSLKKLDWVALEWYETNKRIWHKKTASGLELSAKFLGSNPQLAEGDILFEDASTIIVVSIIPTNTIVVQPANMQEMAAISYEIGNKHLPLYYDDNKLLVPFDLPLYKLLIAKGYTVKEAMHKLSQPLQTSVAPHGSTIMINPAAAVKISNGNNNINNTSPGKNNADVQALLSLLQLSDPALPIGGFSHSAGLETYVQQGIVKDKITAQSFIGNMLKENLHYTDAALLSLAFDATQQNNLQELLELDVECTAIKLPGEMRMASQKLGTRLLKIFRPLCNHELLEQYYEAIQKKDAHGHYAIVFGQFASIMHIPKLQALTGFYYNAAAGMVTNSVKLIPLSQQTGQELLFSFHGLINQLALQSMQPDKTLLGVCCNAFDIRSMQHEQLYSRLYMS